MSAVMWQGAGRAFRHAREIRRNWWNEAVHHSRAARILDEWWYERSQLPGMVLAFVAEVSVYVIGITCTPLSVPAVMVLARLAACANEFHTGYLAIRHRDKSRFDQPQLWRRTRDGRIAPVDINEVSADNPFAAEGAVAAVPVDMSSRPLWQRIIQPLADFATQRRRLPSFIFGAGTPVLAFAMHLMFGTPVVLTTLISYFTAIAQSTPMLISFGRAIKDRSIAYVNKPQIHAERHFRRRYAEASLDLAGQGAPELESGVDVMAPPEGAPPPTAPARLRPVGVPVRRRSLVIREPRVSRAVPSTVPRTLAPRSTAGPAGLDGI